MFAVRIRQSSVKLAREGIELLEEGPVHICIFTVLIAREPLAVCAKTDQLSLLFHLARGDHHNWLFLCCHSAGSIHVGSGLLFACIVPTPLSLLHHTMVLDS